MLISQQPFRLPGRQTSTWNSRNYTLTDAKVTKAIYFKLLVLSSNISVLGIAAAPVSAKILQGFYIACAYSTPKVITKMYTIFLKDNYHQVYLNGV